MKKRFVSFMLVMAMALGLVSSGFAASASNDSGPMRDPNRYYYTYETKPWGKGAEITISEEQATVKDLIKAAMVEALLAAAGEATGLGTINGLGDKIADNIYGKEPFARAGTYKVSTEMEYKYQVDRLDKTKRSVVAKWFIGHYELYQNGKLVDSYSYKMPMK